MAAVVPRFLLDADAFHAARSLGLIDALFPPVRLELTGYVARHELSTCARDIDAWVTRGTVRVNTVNLDSDAGQAYRRLFKDRARRDYRVDKGECESVAWGLRESPMPVFISCDTGARQLAIDEGLPTGDLLLMVCLLVDDSSLTLEKASTLLQPWDEKHSGLCRPKDYQGLPDALARRRASE